MKNRNHTDHSIVKIDLNAESSPGDQMRLDLTQTKMKKHQLILAGKSRGVYYYNNNLNKYIDLTRVFKMIWDTRVTVIPIEAIGTVPSNREKILGQLSIYHRTIPSPSPIIQIFYHLTLYWYPNVSHHPDIPSPLIQISQRLPSSWYPITSHTDIPTSPITLISHHLSCKYPNASHHPDIPSPLMQISQRLPSLWYTITSNTDIPTSPITLISHHLLYRYTNVSNHPDIPSPLTQVSQRLPSPWYTITSYADIPTSSIIRISHNLSYRYPNVSHHPDIPSPLIEIFQRLPLPWYPLTFQTDIPSPITLIYHHLLYRYPNVSHHPDIPSPLMQISQRLPSSGYHITSHTDIPTPPIILISHHLSYRYYNVSHYPDIPSPLIQIFQRLLSPWYPNVVYSHAYTFTYTHAGSCRKNHNDTTMKDERRLFRKICTSHFIVRVRKGLLRVILWEGVGDRTKTAIYWPHSYGHQRCVFFVLLMLNRRAGGPLCWLSLLHLITNLSGPQTPSGVPSAPSAGCGFPYHILTPTSLISTVWLPVLTELYNSSTPTQSRTQSPTQSLEWHVWSSSSGNNCHAVQRSLSSGASVYECTMGFFTLSHFVSQASLCDFLS